VSKVWFVTGTVTGLGREFVVARAPSELPKPAGFGASPAHLASRLPAAPTDSDLMGAPGVSSRRKSRSLPS
jgi:hypothetical protein